MSKQDLQTLQRTQVPASANPFLGMLQKMAPQIQSALPKHMTVDRTLRLVLTAFRNNDKLGKCSYESIAGSIVTLSQMGLEIGVLGQAYLVPYYNTKSGQLECQGIPGWRGIVDLVNRSGRGTIWSGAVYDGDEFDYELGSDPFVRHRPGPQHGIGTLLYTYAIGKVKGAEVPIIEVWSNPRLIAHRNHYNKVGDRHYSFDNWEMYARKVPLLQAAKYMPTSVELQQALEAEDHAERGVTIDLQAAMGGDWTAPQQPQQPQQPEQPETGGQQQAGAAQRETTQETADKPPPQQSRKAQRAAAAAAPKEPAPTPKDANASDPITPDEVMKAILDATTLAEIDVADDLIRSFPEKQQAMLKPMADNKRQRLAAGVDLKLE